MKNVSTVNYHCYIQTVDSIPSKLSPMRIRPATVQGCSIMHADDKKGCCERYFNISSLIPQRLSQLLSLFVAIALTPSMLLADNEDHLNGRDKAHDPTGAWLVRNDEPRSLFILDVFHKDGTCTGDIQGASAFVPGGQPPSNVINSPESGVWQKTGWNTFAATFLSIEYQGDPNAT